MWGSPINGRLLELTQKNGGIYGKMQIIRVSYFSQEIFGEMLDFSFLGPCRDGGMSLV